MQADNSNLPTKSTPAEVEAFLREVAKTPLNPKGTVPGGRLLYAMDATARREPSWNQACNIQGEMFTATNELGGLKVKHCFYRGFRELMTSGWCNGSARLLQRMEQVRYAAGITQIDRLLCYAKREAARLRVDAMVFIADSMEEDINQIGASAAHLGLLSVPVFVFQEGFDQSAERSFREIARLTKGAYCRFDPSRAKQFGVLLGAVAVYASGGHDALEQFGENRGQLVSNLLCQIGKAD
jgi:hypothetical protein